MMKQYDSYKDSGVEWIGKIPSHWSVFRIRYNYYLKGRIGWQGLKADEFIDEGPYLITGTDFINGKVNWDTCYHISQERYDEAPEIHVKEGDLLITKDGTVGKTAYIDNVPGPSSLNSHLLIIRPFNEKCNNLFLQYVINSQIFDSFMRIFQTGSIMASISQEKFCDFRLPLPSKKEQRSILLYLDKKCEEIDKAIATQEKRVELLKELRQNIITKAVTRGINSDVPLKDSGVKWIGMIPSHWDVVPLKRKMQIIRGGSPRPIEQYLSDEGYNWIKIGDTVKGDKYIRNTSQKIKREGLSATRLVHRGDLILSNSMSFGEPYIIDFEEGCIHDGWLSLSHLNNVDKEFLYYTLLSELCKKQFESFVDGGVVKNLNIDKAGYAIIFIPPLSEQQEIVSYIETQTARLDKSIEKAEHQIELLQELKQSIITEVVTGKRKVD